jgi:hypothetical protein
MNFSDDFFDELTLNLSAACRVGTHMANFYFYFTSNFIILVINTILIILIP